MQPSSEPHKYGCDILNVVLFSFVFCAFYGFCLFSVTVWIKQQITHTKTWTTDFTFAARFFILSLDRMSIFRRKEWPQNCLLRQFDVILIVFLWFMSVSAVLRPWLTESNHLFVFLFDHFDFGVITISFDSNSTTFGCESATQIFRLCLFVTA